MRFVFNKLFEAEYINLPSGANQINIQFSDKSKLFPRKYLEIGHNKYN